MMNEVASRLVAQSASPWWRGATIYQVYPRSFADSNGDGVGDLAGITAHLDYIAGLGVDMVWLSPFFKSPMRDFGYDVAENEGLEKQRRGQNREWIVARAYPVLMCQYSRAVRRAF